MTSICVILQAQKGQFSHADGYDNVSLNEMEVLLQHAREVVGSLEEQLRPQNGNTTSAKVQGHLNALTVKIGKLKRQNALSGKDITNVETSRKRLAITTDVPQTRQSKRDETIFRGFVQRIQRRYDDGIVLLCIISIGRQKMIKMSETVRENFVASLQDLLKEEAGTHTLLQSLAEEHLGKKPVDCIES